MRHVMAGGEIEIEYEPNRPLGLGRGCVKITFPDLGNLKIRVTLEDAENIGEKLIEVVRAAEGNTVN